MKAQRDSFSASSNSSGGGVRKSSLSKRAIDRDSTIRRFQETPKDSSYLDFDDDFDLSYSRFSQSIKSGQSSEEGVRPVDSSESIEEKKSYSSSKLNFSAAEVIPISPVKMFSIQEKSPFVEQQDAEYYINDREFSPSKKSYGEVSPKKSYGETSPKKSYGDASPRKGYGEVSPDRKSGRARKSDIDYELENLKLRYSDKKIPTLSALQQNATPTTPTHHQPSVKISLTPAQRLTGSKIFHENYQFSTLVGKGAFANVYKGINLKTNQIVAIKQILLERDQDVMELMGEIDLLKILKHANIVKYHGFVKTSTSLNIFLEFCSGGSLRQLYKKSGPIPEPQIIKYVQSILAGLNYLHEQGVVHRDVKAANVLTTENGEVKLADFGVASKVNSQHDTVVGTPNWMAPETVLGGEGLCTASDIWSLGATIIELFTTNPPYHDLNPMATLHAIGTDDHPPLPKNISSLARDFLLACFQKESGLRIGAKGLLRHRWLADKGIGPSRIILEEDDMSHLQVYPNVNGTDNVSNLNANASHANISNATSANISHVDPTITKSQLLARFSEQNESTSFDSTSALLLRQSEFTEDDPFLNIDIENFDTNELEIQSKMEYLVGKFTNRLLSLNEDVLNSLIKITGRMLHMVKKYHILHQVLIKEHGLLSLLELLESASEFPSYQKLYYHILAILNNLFSSNLSIFENFCLIGGIPSVTQFRVQSNDLNVRLQVVLFLNHFNKSDTALPMLISCGGLKVISKFVEEDFDLTPTFPLVSIECIHNILLKTKSKSDLCRILSKYGVVFWFVVLLNRLTKTVVGQVPISQEQVDLTIDRILDILKYFSESEKRVKLNICQVDLFKLLVRVYGNVEGHRKVVILKFFKAMSCVSEILKSLYQAEILEFLVPLLLGPTEVVNIVCPTLYNCCYLNHSKEVEIVKLGAIPHLKKLSMTNLPYKQFVLPILCELVHCDVKSTLTKNDILLVYFSLLLDPYWQLNSLDSILSWYYQDNSLNLSIVHLIDGFALQKVSNVESTLDNYLKLININVNVAKQMCREDVFDNILIKLNVYMKNPVVQLTLLRILKVLIGYNKGKVLDRMYKVVGGLESRGRSVLVDELAGEILAMANK